MRHSIRRMLRNYHVYKECSETNRPFNYNFFDQYESDFFFFLYRNVKTLFIAQFSIICIFVNFELKFCQSSLVID